MGLLAKIKETFSAQRYIFRALSEMDRQNAAYASMTQTELEALSDNDLISAVLYRTDKKLDTLLGKKKKGSPVDWSAHLSGAPRIAYILFYFESDLQTGGLEYFFRRNGGFAPMVSDCLKAIGAQDHLALCNTFFSAHGHDLRHIALIEYHEEIAEFDRAYAELPPMEPILAPYLRAHLSEF